MNEDRKCTPEFVVALGSDIFCRIMSSPNANAALQAMAREYELPETATFGACAEQLAKNCIDYARSFAAAANEFLANHENGT